MFLFILQCSKLVGMFGMEAASAENATYYSFPSNRFLTSVDDTLRADNLSPSSSQGSPAISDRNDKQLTELEPRIKPTSNISRSRTSTSPSYYSSLYGMTTPTSTSSSYYSLLYGMTTFTSTSPSYYSSLDGMTTPYTEYSQYSTPTSVNYPFSTSPPPLPKSMYPL